MKFNQKPVEYSKYIVPACIPEKDENYGGETVYEKK